MPYPVLDDRATHIAEFICHPAHISFGQEMLRYTLQELVKK